MKNPAARVTALTELCIRDRKMRERRTIRIRPLSRAYNATPKNTRSMAESAM